MNFMFSWPKNNISLVRNSNIHVTFISSRQCVISSIYYMEESVLLGTKPLVDSIRHFIRDPSGVFIFRMSPLWVSYRSMTSRFLPFAFVELVSPYRGNFRLALGTILENLPKSSDSGLKSSENHQKCHHQYVYVIKKTLHVSLKIWILCSRRRRTISHLFASLTREILFLPLEHKIDIFSPPCNILYVF